MKEKGIEHSVLNARYHEQEAGIIAQAGGFGAVTIATNMAGRGTDIQLGGNVDFRILRPRPVKVRTRPSLNSRKRSHPNRSGGGAGESFGRRRIAHHRQRTP